jgi:hypothetical protein
MTTSRPEHETKFGQLAASFATLKFTAPLPPALETLAGSFAENPSLRPKNCYKIGNRWFVKFYFAGVQRVWAVFNFFQYSEALRVADMLRYYLNDKRVMKTKPALTEEDFSLTPTQAKTDCENEGEIFSVIVQMVCVFPVRLAKRKPRTTLGRPRTAAQRFDAFENRLIDMERKLDLLLQSTLRPCGVGTLVAPAPEIKPTWIGDDPNAPKIFC